MAKGMFKLSDGSFLVMTYTESKYFKTEKGAIKWLAKRGLNKNGTKLK